VFIPGSSRKKGSIFESHIYAETKRPQSEVTRARMKRSQAPSAKKAVGGGPLVSGSSSSIANKRQCIVQSPLSAEETSPKKQEKKENDEGDGEGEGEVATENIKPAPPVRSTIPKFRSPLIKTAPMTNKTACTPSPPNTVSNQPSSSASTEDRYFSVLWCKKSNKKHKTWSDGL